MIEMTELGTTSRESNPRCGCAEAYCICEGKGCVCLILASVCVYLGPKVVDGIVLLRCHVVFGPRIQTRLDLLGEWLAF